MSEKKHFRPRKMSKRLCLLFCCFSLILHAHFVVISVEVNFYLDLKKHQIFEGPFSVVFNCKLKNFSKTKSAYSPKINSTSKVSHHVKIIVMLCIIAFKTW